MSSTRQETMTETEVTYTLASKGNICVIEHVPARVSQEIGKQFFARETVEHIHEPIDGNSKPNRAVQTPVYEYAWRKQSTPPIHLSMPP